LFVDTAYKLRLYCVYSTHWRRTAKTVGQASADFELSDRFRSFYLEFKTQLPELLNQRVFGDHEVAFRASTLGKHVDRHISAAAEIVLFSLPFPANQIVASLVLDVPMPDLNVDSDDLRQILEACTNGELDVTIRDKRLPDLVDELIAEVNGEREKPADPKEKPGPRERHVLVFVTDLNGSPAPQHETVAGILYGIQPPYRPEFTNLQRPPSLNQEEGSYSAVSQSSSFFYGQSIEVENSAFLTTVQAVGTAARFQRIWQDAYYQVQKFQSSGRQAKEAGLQDRKGLEILADEMGNLELDLAFSVETAADLGLGSTTSRIDDFHDSLYQVMHIKTRASTVSQMFVRLGSSIRSELTAIESREKEIEDDRRFRGAVTLGILSFVLAPAALVLAFFGINARQIKPNDTMFDWHHYWGIYVLAGLVMIVPVFFALSFDRDALNRFIGGLHLRRKRRAVDTDAS
jgi:hypothetical protein